MSPQSILHGRMIHQEEPIPLPRFFYDLHLDRIENALCMDEKEYGLETVFRHPPDTISVIRYRQAVFADLQDNRLRMGLEQFSTGMRETRKYLDFSVQVHQPSQRQKWKLDAASRYATAIRDLDTLLVSSGTTLHSEALLSFRDWLHTYVRDPAHVMFEQQLSAVASGIHQIRYALRLEGNRLFIDPDPECDDVCAEMQQTFSVITDMPFTDEIHFFHDLEMCALEVEIHDCLQKQHPDPFRQLGLWAASCPDFPSSTLSRFDRDLRFYLAWLSFLDPLKRMGLPFTLPVLAEEPLLRLRGFYDLALALDEKMRTIVMNDCLLDPGERCMVLTGPNQGGKTTYARALGQLAYLASLGCPVPARQAAVFHCENVLTHFSVEEDPLTQSGRLREELLRMKVLLHGTTPRSLVLLNELFSTTSTNDAIELGRRMLASLSKIGCHCLYVTHLSELAGEKEGNVSLVASVDADHPEIRTYRILRRPADGLAYAQILAARHGLDDSSVRSHFPQKEEAHEIASSL